MATSPSPQPSAGWYPDPNGKSGQMYCDGQEWLDIPAPEIPATPGARFPWRKIIKIALIGIAVYFVGAVVVALVSAGVRQTHLFDHRPSPSSSSSPGSSPTSDSPSYQAGYDSGTSGLARNTYGEEFDTSDVPKSEQYACSVAFTGQNILNASLTEDDYVKGCLKAFSDHPPAKTSKPQ